MNAEHCKRIALSLVTGGLVLIGLLLLMSGTAQVTHADYGVRYVAPDGSDLFACKEILNPCRTIQHAIESADLHDTIWVATGAYTSTGASVITVTKTITLYGGWDGATEGVRDPETYPTILDGEGERRVIHISGFITPTLDGFVITNGNATFATVEAGCGGGLYSVEASPIIQNNIIISNVGTISGTVGAGGGIYGFRGSPVIQNNVIVSNVASIGPMWSNGGGIFLWQATSGVISGNRVISNTAIGYPSRGGGLSLNTCNLTVHGNLIQGNVSSHKAGGVYLGYSELLFVDNEVRGNVSGGSAGGLHLEWSPSVIQGNLIVENEASGAGGGLRVSAEGPTITANRILSNRASTAAGLGLYTVSYFTVTNNVIAYNDNDGIKLGEYNRYSLIAHNTIAYNGGDGGIRLAYGYITPTIVNNVIVSNTYGIRAHTNASGTLDYNDVWGNTTQDYDLPGALEPGAHDIQADPLFVDALGNDYHLRLGSPCVDMGLDVGVLTDMDGDPRPNDLGPDIGADEYYFSCVTALTGTGISGPGSGYTGTLYTFTAVVTPSNATPPITYTWSPEPDAGQSSAVVSYTWTTSNTQVITLTAENCGGSDTVTHTITIEAKGQFAIYLPAVLKSYSSP